MPVNPYAQYARPTNPYAVFQTAGTGPKPATGYATAGAAVTPQTYIPGGEADPAVIARNAQITANVQAAKEAGLASMRSGLEARNTSSRIAAELAADKEKALFQQGLNSSPKLTAEEKSKAVAGYQAADLLDKQIGNIEALYKQGPGATSGFSGLSDYLPTTINQRFDNAGNSVRGLVGQALGFTGGQLNTEKEAAAAVGPYLPQAGDRDEVILDKIQRLKDLRDQARGRAVQQLGGVPDQSGNITPVQQRQGLPVGASGGNGPPPPSGGSGGQPSPPSAPSTPPTLSVATGSTRTQDDTQANAIINAMVRSGASVDQVNAALSAVGSGTVKPEQYAAAQAYLAKNPGYKGSFGGATKQVDQSIINRAAGSPFGAYAINAADALTAGNLDSLTGDPVAARAALKSVSAANPGSSLLGNITGSALAAGGLEAGLGRIAGGVAGVGGRILANPLTADAAYGAAYGAGSNDDNRLAGAAGGAALGAAGGMFGRRLASGVGGALRGVQNSAVDYLRGQGVPLTVGQAVSQGGTVGQAIKGVEDRLTGVPGVGNLINARRGEGIDAFDRAAFNQATSPLSGQVTPITATTPDIGALGIEQLRNIRSQGYSNAVAGRSAVADPTFGSDYATSLTAASAIPNEGQRVAGEIGAIVPDYFTGPNATGTITGENAQAAIKELKGLRSAHQSDALGFRTGNAIRSTEDALTGLFDRQNPGFSQDLALANRTNTNLKVLEDAVKAAKNTGERFLPSQLNTASVRSANNFGGAGATTARPFYDLVQAGQAVLPSKVPDSGTAGRLATLALPAALGGTGTGIGYATGDAQTGGETGLALGALLAAGGTRAGQKALTSLLLDRPDAVRRLGGAVAARKRIAGMFGAGLGASLPYLGQ